MKNINEIISEMPPKVLETYLGFCDILGKKSNTKYEDFTNEQKEGALKLLEIYLKEKE